MNKKYIIQLLFISLCNPSVLAQYDLLNISKIDLPLLQYTESINIYGNNILSITITSQNDIFIEVSDKDLAKEVFGSERIYGFFNPDSTLKTGFEFTGLINSNKADISLFKKISNSEDFSNIVLKFRKLLKKKNNNSKIDFTYLINQDKNSEYWLYDIACNILVNSNVRTIFLNSINNEKNNTVFKTTLVDFNSGNTVKIGAENVLFIWVSDNNELTTAKGKKGIEKKDTEEIKKRVELEDNEPDSTDYKDIKAIDAFYLAPEFIGDIPNNGDKISITDLKMKLEYEYSENNNLIIAVYLSSKTKYQTMLDILNAINSANIEKRYVIMPNE